jgi:hypothetical protein
VVAHSFYSAKHCKPIKSSGFKKPRQPSGPALCKFQQKLFAMAAVNDMPDISGNIVAGVPGHRVSTILTLKKGAERSLYLSFNARRTRIGS